MKNISLAKGVFAAGLAVACSWGLVACSSSSSDDVQLTGGVAATVNGTEISEDKVTLAIESVRDDMDLTDADSWGEWLAQYGYTPQSVREEVIDTYADQEVLRQHAADKGVSVDDATVQSYVDEMKANYDNDDARWQQALDSVGITEDEYRENIELSLLSRGVKDTFATDEDPSDDEMLETANTYLSSYDGAKRSSHILFDSDDEQTAQEVLDQINVGTISFEDAAKQYSKDSSASNGGDVGWDKLTNFVDEYQEALDGLEKGQVSGLVTSQYGIHIIKCTDVFNAPDELTSMDQLPSEFVDAIKQIVNNNKQQQAYDDWLQSCRDESDIVINDMPENVPYNVDMSKYESDDESSDSGESGDASDDESAADDASSDGDAANGEADQGSSEGDNAEQQ